MIPCSLALYFVRTEKYITYCNINMWDVRPRCCIVKYLLKSVNTKTNLNSIWKLRSQDETRKMIGLRPQSKVCTDWTSTKFYEYHVSNWFSPLYIRSNSWDSQIFTEYLCDNPCTLRPVRHLIVEFSNVSGSLVQVTISLGSVFHTVFTSKVSYGRELNLHQMAFRARIKKAYFNGAGKMHTQTGN